MIEWKFTEGISRALTIGRFCGLRGNERLRRYSDVLASLRKKKSFPFQFAEEYHSAQPMSWLSLADFSIDHLYQLMRMTLLGIKTVNLSIGDLVIEDYRILHLTHSQNDMTNILQPKDLKFSPGLQSYVNQDVHAVWKSILSDAAKHRFFHGYWNTELDQITDPHLYDYLNKRYA